jgi:hypothetical protein
LTARTASARIDTAETVTADTWIRPTHGGATATPIVHHYSTVRTATKSVNAGQIARTSDIAIAAIHLIVRNGNAFVDAIGVPVSALASDQSIGAATERRTKQRTRHEHQ